jgi:glycosyltransferase involved in cell wall biosynthesis
VTPEQHEIVLVHDYLGQFGGAERVVEELCSIYPEAPLYTSYYASSKTYDSFRGVDVRTSLLNHAPGIAKHHRWYFLAYPFAFSTMRLPECRVVLSSSSAFAKGVCVPKGAVHVCYCHAPMRFAWDLGSYARFDSALTSVRQALVKPFMGMLRSWDVSSTRHVDLLVANSENVAKRIHRFYSREAIVVYPPVALDQFHASDDAQDFYLVVSRLVAYKRVDLAVRACSDTGRRLFVVGDGPDRARLEASAGPSVTFLGRVEQERVANLLATCRALLFCGEEDFGITPLEAMASGRPVIALGRGGALETVVEGETGIFFQEPVTEALVAALGEFESMSFRPAACIERAHRFGPDQFRDGIMNAVATASHARSDV